MHSERGHFRQMNDVVFASGSPEADSETLNSGKLRWVMKRDHGPEKIGSGNGAKYQGVAG